MENSNIISETWKLTTRNNGDSYEIVNYIRTAHVSREFVIAETKLIPRTWGNELRNARIMAAGLDLLEAAKLGLECALADSGNVETEDSIKIRAAITKAEGKP